MTNIFFLTISLVEIKKGNLTCLSNFPGVRLSYNCLGIPLCVQNKCFCQLPQQRYQIFAWRLPELKCSWTSQRPHKAVCHCVVVFVVLKNLNLHLLQIVLCCELFKDIFDIWEDLFRSSRNVYWAQLGYCDSAWSGPGLGIFQYIFQSLADFKGQKVHC